ncbi:TPA: hypothetical protein HA246_00395 [Candidatus Woesearchaeota archaeon]|nr:hypothetical protein [Candidatus Woesearchaeota archaeon]
MPRKDDDFGILEEIKEAKHDRKSFAKMIGNGNLTDFEMDLLMLDEE